MKLSEQFDRLRADNEGALIAYITLGDPSPAESLAIAQSLIDSGAVDVLELGVPFSDPIADGPVIQAAVDRALKAGMNTNLAFEIAGALDKKVPIVYLTYYNIVLQYRDRALRGILRKVRCLRPHRGRSALRGKCRGPDGLREARRRLHQHCDAEHRPAADEENIERCVRLRVSCFNHGRNRQAKSISAGPPARGRQGHRRGRPYARRRGLRHLRPIAPGGHLHGR